MARRKRSTLNIHSWTSQLHWPVLLWIPNICTYLRIAACGKAFSVAYTDKKLFTVLYTVCFVANEFSRIVARLLNQNSTLGDVLIHVASRVSNTGLLLVLSHLYRRDYRVLLLILELDIVGHWLRVYCDVMSKRRHCPHLDEHQNQLFCNPFFRLFCGASQEVMYISLYLMSFDWMEHGQPVKLDYQKIKYSKYFQSLAMATPGYIMRLIITLDEIRLSTDMCVHFDHQSHCQKGRAVAHHGPQASTKRRRRRSRSRSHARHGPRSHLRFEHEDDVGNDY